ncbi:MAG: pentapeptide repeat-containing protein, partial [Desulfobulbaceae bacterium]|nr:pentapeptide repeat-containing protein [Desulfobulbaceae bacterium]
MNSVDMTKTILTNGDLSGADLTESNLSHAFMSGANLTKADLTNANLANADLKRANLTGINLTSTFNIKLNNIKNSLFKNAKVTKFDLRNADLSNANLAYADLSNVDLTNADLTNADLTKANLSDADLRWANLTDANLTGADLTNANLNDADLNRANLMKANLTDVDIFNVKNIEKAENVTTSSELPATNSKIEQNALLSKNNENLTSGSIYASIPESEKDVKIWGLEIEGFGRVQDSFEHLSDLGQAYEDLTDVEANLLKHRMFSDKSSDKSKKSNLTYGILYSVNFIPASKEIPVEIKWISPTGKIVRSTVAKTRYLERQVTAHSFKRREDIIPGTWNVKFYHENRLIEEQNLVIGAPEVLRTQTKSKKGASGDAT